ncbi:MAG: hypothetical protein K2Q26_08870 [Bdellovibrionales bacterium]|nr:hypothetical protein [Bdellovibrionales bacterium]
MNFKHFLFVATLIASTSSLAQYQRSYAKPSLDDNYSFSGGSSFFVSGSLFYMGDSVNLSSSRDRFDLLGRLILGYKYNDWNFGLELDSDNEKNTFKDASGDTEYSWSRTAVGAMAGYNYKSFFLNLTLFAMPTLKTKAPSISDTTYSGDLGYQLVLGYNYDVTTYMTLGIQLAYRAFEYKKMKTGGAETNLSEKYNTSAFDPFINATFYFR